MHTKTRRWVTSILTVLLSMAMTGAPQVAQATTTILGSFPLVVSTLDKGSVTITPPTSNSPGKFTLTSSDPLIASFNGFEAIFHRSGTVTITATQEASGLFTGRARTTQLRVEPGTPKYGSFLAQSVPIAQHTFTITPPASTSDGFWTYSSSNPNIATVVGNVVTFLDGGTISIIANQGSTLNWKAGSITLPLTIVAVNPNIGTFGSISIMKDSVASLTLVAPTSSSPGAWTFTSSNPSVATVVGNTLTPIAFGTSTITASQAHSGNYGSASVSMILTVLGPVPTIGAFPDLTAPFTSPALMTVFLQAPTSNSTGVWGYTASDPSVASLVGNKVTLLKPGRITISAVQSATATFAASVPVTMTLTVVGAPTIGAWANIEKVVKDPDFTLTPPTSASPGTWTFSSANSAIAEVTGSVVKVGAAGQTVITATQAATPIYSASTAQMTIIVHGAIPTLGTFAAITASVGDAPIKITPPTSNSTGAWIFTSSDPKVATAANGTLTIVGNGVATITATQSAAGIYSQSNTVSTTVTIKPKTTTSPSPSPSPSITPKPTPTPTPTVTPKPSVSPTVTPKPSVSPTVTPKPSVSPTTTPKPTTSPTPTPSSTGPAVADFPNMKIEFGTIAPTIVPPVTTSKVPWTYQSSNTKVVTFAGTFIVMRGIGTSTITATQLGTAGSTAVVKKFKIEVYPSTGQPAPIPKVSVKAVGHVITIAVTSGTATVTINGKPGKIGKNAVKVGVNTVLVRINGSVVYLKNFTIK